MLEETVITKELIKEYSKLSVRPTDKSLIQACSDSVIIFSKHMLGIELYTWQKIIALDIMKAIEDETINREFIIVTSRQIGKTTMAAIMALWISVFNKLPSDIGNNSDCGVISMGDRQAKLLLKEINTLIRIGDVYCREHYSQEKGDEMDKGIISMLIDEKEDNNKEMITFKRAETAVEPRTGAITPKYGSYFLKDSRVGTHLKSYPPTPTILGQKFAYLHEDECGRADRFEDEAHYEFIKPTGVARNAIRIYTSTPWVPHGFFYELCDPDDVKASHDYKRYLFSIEAIQYENPKQYAHALADIKTLREDGKNSEVERAFYCRFVKGDESYFDPENVDEMFCEEKKIVYDSELKVDIGVDFGGQVKSKTVITVTNYDEVSGEITRLYHRSYEVGEDSTLLEDLEYVMSCFPNWQRIIPDDCPQGDYLIREMKDRGWNVEPMNFRTWKIKKYGAFRSKLNKGLIKSYPDADLKIEMKALEFGQGNVQSKISAPRGYTDDLIDSFVMSCFFFLEDEGGYEFYSWRDFL